MWRHLFNPRLTTSVTVHARFQESFSSLIRQRGTIKRRWERQGQCLASFTMSVIRSLLFLAAMVCTAPFCAAQWPCPAASDITPCICTSNPSYEITMDCSNVISSAQLAQVFQTPFAFNDFKRLIIQPGSPYGSLVDLPAGVFGEVSFEQIDITNTFIHTVEELALVNSHETLLRLNMRGNEISSFPFETLNLFIYLRELDLANNKLSGLIPDIVTQELISLDLSFNRGFLLTDTAFSGSPYLQVLILNSMDLGNTSPPNVFLALNSLTTLYLENNGMSGTLIEDFINISPSSLTTVRFDGNSLSQIHPLSVTGMRSGGTISFRSNLIEYLPQENWEGLVTSFLPSTNAIDMIDNPLVCGCDMAWLVSTSSYMAVFDSMTTCVTGNLITTLDPIWFGQHCP